jgi:gamma-glutamylcysteine synthetase
VTLQLHKDIAKRGLQAEIKGVKMLDYCKQVLDIASENLRSFADLDEKEQDESVHLQPIKEFVFVKEKSPGEWVRDQWDGEWKQNPERLIEWCSFES